jgi:hypothetical protein
MENWTLVYRAHRGKLSSRRRVVTAYYRDATTAYNMLCAVLRHESEGFGTRERVSHAYLRRPDGEKIPLLSGVPPYQIITREQLKEAETHLRLLPTRRGRLPVDREVLRRRLESTKVQFLHISQDALIALAHIDTALWARSEYELAALCQQVLGSLEAPPRPCPPNREPLQRRLYGLARQARAAFPGTALVLTYLGHAFAEGKEHRVLTVCRTFQEVSLAARQQTGPAAVSSPK